MADPMILSWRTENSMLIFEEENKNDRVLCFAFRVILLVNNFYMIFKGEKNVGGGKILNRGPWDYKTRALPLSYERRHCS